MYIKFLSIFFFTIMTPEINQKAEFNFRNIWTLLTLYDKSAFSSGFEESRQDRIVLQDIDGSALQLLIDYVYTAEVLVTEENVQVSQRWLVWLLLFFIFIFIFYYYYGYDYQNTVFLNFVQ